MYRQSNTLCCSSYSFGFALVSFGLKSPPILKTQRSKLRMQSPYHSPVHTDLTLRDPKFDRLASYGDIYGLQLFSEATKPVGLSPPSGVGLCSGFFHYDIDPL